MRMRIGRSVRRTAEEQAARRRFRCWLSFLAVRVHCALGMVFFPVHAIVICWRHSNYEPIPTDLFRFTCCLFLGTMSRWVMLREF